MSALLAMTPLPILILAGAVTLVLLAIALRVPSALVTALTVAGVVAAGAAAVLAEPIAPAMSPEAGVELMTADPLSRFSILLFAACTLVILVFARCSVAERREELHLLLLLALLGASVLASSGHFASLFLGLEILSVSLYVLIAYPRTGGPSIEAAIKYLVLGGASSAFLLFGMALLYIEHGTLDIGVLGARVRGAAPADPMLLAGFALFAAGFGFKLAVVPFHMWTPDVYQGARSPIAAFTATVSKGAAIAALLRALNGMGAAAEPRVVALLSVIAGASMLAGSLLALRQNDLKRILAYSSISHIGYVLAAVIAGGGLALEAIAYYLVAYFASVLVAFGVITARSGGGAEIERIEDYRGLIWRRPLLAGALILSLLSLAGIPITAGFVAKVYVVATGVDADLWPLLVILIASSAIAIYYYLRVVIAMAMPPVASPVADATPAGGAGVSAALAALALIVVVLGVYPDLLMRRLSEVEPRSALAGGFDEAQREAEVRQVDEIAGAEERAGGDAGDRDRGAAAVVQRDPAGDGHRARLERAEGELPALAGDQAPADAQ